MYQFKTYGREYNFTLESDGLLHCNDLGLQHENLEGLKALVTEEVKKEKSAPRIPVLIIEGRWDIVSDYIEGTASSKADRHGYRWVSYKHKGKFDKEEKIKRQTMGQDRLFLDTDPNRQRMSEVVLLGKHINFLKEQQANLLGQMQKIGDPEPENV